MEFSMKEVLRRLCQGRGGWSYAVFWKMGCKNPTLLVWEDGYYEPGLPNMSRIGSTKVLQTEWDALWHASVDQFSHHRDRVEDWMEILVFKLMVNQVHVVGEGVVGRAASMGAHEWILRNVQAGNETVLWNDELQLQFSAGIQTIAIIPVLPHGVVQLGSTHMIMENFSFVGQVKSLFVQLSATSGFHSATDSIEALGQQIQRSSVYNKETVNTPREVSRMSSLGRITDSQQIPKSELYSGSSASLLTHIYDKYQAKASLQSLSSSLILPLSAKPCTPSLLHTVPVVNCNYPLENLLGSDAPNMQVVPNPQVAVNQVAQPCHSSSSNPGYIHTDARMSLSGTSIPVPVKYTDIISLLGNEEPLSVENSSLNSISVDAWRAVNGSNSAPSPVVDHECRTKLSKVGAISDSIGPNRLCYTHENDNDLFQALTILPTISDEYKPSKCQSLFHDYLPSTFKAAKSMQMSQESSCQENATSYNVNEKKLAAQRTTVVDGDLFDALGVELKNKSFCGSSDDMAAHGAGAADESVSGTIPACISELRQPFVKINNENPAGGIFFGSSTESLLDAVIWKVNSTSTQKSEGLVACSTELIGTTSCSDHANTSTYNRGALSEQVLGRHLPLPPPSLAEPMMTQAGSCFEPAQYIKEKECTPAADIKCKSQMSSVVEDGKTTRQNSTSTGNSVRPDEIGRLNRKRPRPGEGSRPRPKDRQMIQDRLKDLREIIPNGAKYSIDALLERTIKHMLFLQSVTKHADDLKHSGKWKSRDGGLLLKESFEGGATWAYEVGSQSMLCPIIVEDLNEPHQMLVEMLCEEQGFFLEIADTIRSMGLTILKGVMESRNGSIWARFAVEAHKDVTRMDVFMSLMRFIETAKISTSNCNSSGHLGHNLQESAVPVTR